MMYLTIQFTISILRLPSLNSHGALIIGLRHVLHIFFSIACQLVEDIIMQLALTVRRMFPKPSILCCFYTFAGEVSEVELFFIIQ